jgi:predicted RecB family nuclease
MQRRDDGSHLFYATDLVNFLGCSHSTVLDIRSSAGELERDEASEGDKLIRRKGLEHERAYLQRLKNEGKSVVEIPTNASNEERVRRTEEALKAGPDVIYQAALAEGDWAGFADFLVRTEQPSRLGSYSYEVIDTKLAKNAEVKHLIQLEIYSDLLGKRQDRIPDKTSLFLGSNEQEDFRVRDFDAYLRHAMRRLESFAESPPADSYPEPCAHCSHCRWRQTCSAQWKKDDHLTLVANISRSQSTRLQQAGIKTVAGLAALPPKAHIPDLHPLTLDRLRSQASLQDQKRQTGQNKLELLASESGKGFARLPKPRAGDLFFDMEGDPLHPNGLEYLFGICFDNGDGLQFRPFWAHSHDEEKEKFGEFMAFVLGHMKSHPEAYIYHYNHYETTALKRLASRYGLFEHELDDLLRRLRFVDLYKVVREAIRVSEPSYSLKNLEVFYMEKRHEEVATAGDSIVVYNRWRETGNADLLRQIEDYNKVDCISTAKLREWLLTLRPANVEWFAGPIVKTEPSGDEEKSPERLAREERFSNYRQRLREAATDGKKDFRTGLIDLLEFHAREDKPHWWEHFDRRDRVEDEWLDDTECLAGLEQTGSPEKVKRSLVHTFRYPPQDTKRKVGDNVVDVATLEKAGQIVAMDEAKRIVRIRASSPLPENLSVGPGQPINTKVLREAVYRFADDAMTGGHKHAAVRDILKKALPRFCSRMAGEPIARGNDLLAATLDAAAELDESYLFIQGPPGAGKTHTSAHVIVELIRRGKKIGVAANSHKVIHNLLSKIEEMAASRKVEFVGLKKSSSDESEFEGRLIQNCSKNDDMSLDADLLAGTAWLFADERFDRHLDYLFIDEAGQISVANVVAMGTSAKNIVLVGDQMQLGQPTRGIHPEEAGLSILEFLLGGRATVAPERGIFLDHTRRLHPSVCRFISDAFYDGRLAPDSANARRRLIFDKPIDGIRPDGIHFLPILHNGCSQKSEEEGKVVEENYLRLLGQTFEDVDGTRSAIEADDILVVSPYNVQVNYLTSILPDGARVGTVDKFQGQEAPIVLVSMATSDAECLPRNIDFLFSANRLNVAISRAQCLAIVVASPKLLETPCQTIEQLRLVNNFCKLAEYAESSHHAPRDGLLKVRKPSRGA